MGGVGHPVRLATAEDAERIAEIQLAAWRAAYRAIMPAAFLAAQEASARAERWRGRLGAAAEVDSPTFVSLDTDGRVTGFVHTGPLRDDDVAPEGRAEIYTLYVDPGAWGRGIGSRLVAEAETFWIPRAVHELLLWVFEENGPARRFYERLEWRHDGASKLDDFGGTRAVELRYRRSYAR